MIEKVNIYLCDDDNNFLNTANDEIMRIMTEKGQACHIFKFVSGNALIEHYKKKKADIVFLDIEMPEINGFDAAEELKRLHENVLIVFLTNYDDRVYQSYEYHPFWFIRKSHLNDLNIVILRFLEKIGFQDKSTHFFDFAAENKHIKIDINKVMYMESKNHYIRIVGEDKAGMSIRGRMIDAENQLTPLHFVRVQNSVIVNLRFISKVKYKAVILKNGDEISISRDRVECVRNNFQRFLRSGLAW